MVTSRSEIVTSYWFWGHSITLRPLEGLKTHELIGISTLHKLDTLKGTNTLTQVRLIVINTLHKGKVYWKLQIGLVGNCLIYLDFDSLVFLNSLNHGMRYPRALLGLLGTHTLTHNMGNNTLQELDSLESEIVLFG